MGTNSEERQKNDADQVADNDAEAVGNPTGTKGFPRLHELAVEENISGADTMTRAELAQELTDKLSPEELSDGLDDRMSPEELVASVKANGPKP